MTIEEALAQLRTVVPSMERSILIQIEVRDWNQYPLGSPQRREVSFGIWDERERYSGPTLESAFNQCLDANRSKEAEAAVVEAESMQAPAAQPPLGKAADFATDDPVTPESIPPTKYDSIYKDDEIPF